MSAFSIRQLTEGSWSRRASAAALLALGALVGVACTPTGFLDAEAVVWPKAARLGDTVALSIDSNHVPLVGVLYERYDLSEDNVSLEIREGTTVLATVTPRAVFDGLSAPASLKNADVAGPFITVVVFDVPSSISTTFPAATDVYVLVDGVEPAYPVVGSLELLGPGGSPTTFIPESEPSALGPRPSLRLQGRAQSGGDGFAPSWVIGAIEFTLDYPSAALSAPDVYPATEASRALAFTSTNDPPGSVRVFLADPRGFTLPNAPGYPGGDRVGEGPLLEIAFAKTPGQGFVPGDFTVRDLKVTDPNGVVLASDSDGADYFALIARKNLAE